jgi:hypothetical protein
MHRLLVEKVCIMLRRRNAQAAPGRAGGQAGGRAVHIQYGARRVLVNMQLGHNGVAEVCGQDDGVGEADGRRVGLQQGLARHEETHRVFR